jgi:hypothetical protein
VARTQGVPLDVAREARRLLWLVERSRDWTRIGELRGRALSTEATASLRRAGTEAQRTGDLIVEDLRSGSITEKDALEQLRGVQRDYAEGFLAEAGLHADQLDQLFADRELSIP